jgi:hypothetical protein
MAGQYVSAALRAGAREQLLAAANILPPEELVAKSHHFLVDMASASAGADVPGHIYTSSKQVRWLLTLCKSG